MAQPAFFELKHLSTGGRCPRIYLGRTEPGAAIAEQGDLFIDIANNKLKLYSGSAWLIVGPPAV